MTAGANLQVRDVMVPLTQYISASQSLVAAKQRMQGEVNVRSLLVLDAEGQLVGMVRYNDLQAASGQGMTVADVMVPGTLAVRADQTLDEITGIMTENDVDRLAVLDESGMVSGELPRSALSQVEQAVSTAPGAPAEPGNPAADRVLNIEAAPTFDVREDMAVIGVDGEKIGKVKEVRADALSGALTHLIVHTGLIFGHDHAVPADLVEGVEGGEVRLKVAKSDVSVLPEA